MNSFYSTVNNSLVAGATIHIFGAEAPLISLIRSQVHAVCCRELVRSAQLSLRVLLVALHAQT